jgi:hypothetical protein
MSRADRNGLPGIDRRTWTAEEPLQCDRAQIAEYIGLAALDMAGLARAAGFTTASYLLESAALDCGAKAVATRWPPDQSQK